VQWRKFQNTRTRWLIDCKKFRVPGSEFRVSSLELEFRVLTLDGKLRLSPEDRLETRNSKLLIERRDYAADWIEVHLIVPIRRALVKKFQPRSRGGIPALCVGSQVKLNHGIDKNAGSTYWRSTF